MAVSGGADSVALLSAARGRKDLRLVVLHLNHQTRGVMSDADGRFVAELSALWNLPCITATLSQIERSAARQPSSSNPSARYRAARLLFFKQQVAAQSLQGVLLGHHAGDQAETVLHRLLRSSPTHPLPNGLFALRREVTLGGLRMLRPLLNIDPILLRKYLLKQPIPRWREDLSNASPQYLRNRLRAVLSAHPLLQDSLCHLSEACQELSRWQSANAPRLPEAFQANQLIELHSALAETAARQWLLGRGCPPTELGPAVISRLVQMCADAGTPSRQQFPGGVVLSRRRGVIAVI